MKKTLIAALGAAMIIMTGCQSAGQFYGAATGASLGGMFGSAIGSITGGWHGRSVGTLAGMAIGGAIGAAATAPKTSDGNYRSSDYYNGYEQGSRPVINACCVTYSKLDMFPWLITLNPAQFVLYTDRLGDRPMMLKYKQYVRYMFAHNKSQSFINLQNCVIPMFDIANEKPIKPTSVSKYAPYIKVLSYEAFEKVSTNVTLNSKDMDEKEIKSVLEKISLDAVEVFGEPVEINKFPEHCQI